MGYGRESARHALRVLFVADDPDRRQDFARLLRPQGFIVDLVSQADEALELAAESPYAWIVVDGEQDSAGARALWAEMSELQPGCHGLLLVAGHHRETDDHPHGEVAATGDALTIARLPWVDEELVRLARGAATHRAYGQMVGAAGDGASEDHLLLLLEDNDFDAAIITRELERESEGLFRVVRARCLSEARELLQKGDFTVMLSDLNLPDATGLASVKELQALAPGTPLLVVTAADDEQQALGALQLGAQDYLLKGQFGGGAVMRAVRYAVERKRIEKRLNHLAHHDQLTGLANRTALNNRVPQALARAGRSGKQTALILVDLDHFKAINDTYGHQVGDRLLVEVAQRLQSSTRVEDTVARLGGDEFAILLEDLEGVNGARRVAQRVVNAFATPIEIDGKTLAMTASLGIALSPMHANTMAELTRRADEALYRAKALGKNAFYVADRDPTPETQRSAVLSRALQGALEGGRFFLAFQPLCQLSDRRVVAHEAFLRLAGPDGGEIDAADILPLLDETGDIVFVGRWVLARACELLRAGEAPEGRISLNVSARELADPGFVDGVQRALQTHELAGSRLELEIAEKTLEKIPVHAKAKLPLLAALGVSITIDDYGLGHTSLPELAELPIAGVKLHPSLLRDLEIARRHAALRAVLAAAKALGWMTVAKCVESQSQWTALRQSGCQLAQGLLVGRPHAGTVAVTGPLPRASTRPHPGV